MTVVPYVQNLTEPIKSVLQQVGVGVAMKPVCVLSIIFCKPKDKVLDKEKSGPAYLDKESFGQRKVSCRFGQVLDKEKYLIVTAMRCTSAKQAEA